jgi:hypothetical protein
MEDYKKLYLEQKRQSLMLEMQLLQMRAQQVGNEMPQIEEELKEYAGKSEESSTDKA